VLPMFVVAAALNQSAMQSRSLGRSRRARHHRLPPSPTHGGYPLWRKTAEVESCTSAIGYRLAKDLPRNTARLPKSRVSALTAEVGSISGAAWKLLTLI